MCTYWPFTLSTITSKGTSRLMTTWTGDILNRLSACDFVLGKPSSSQLRSADDKRFNSPPTICNMSSSGTSCPLETNLNNTRAQYRYSIYEWLNKKNVFSSHELVDLDAEVGFLSYHVPQYVATGYVQHVKRSDDAFRHGTFTRARCAHDQGVQPLHRGHFHSDRTKQIENYNDTINLRDGRTTRFSRQSWRVLFTPL